MIIDYDTGDQIHVVGDSISPEFTLFQGGQHDYLVQYSPYPLTLLISGPSLHTPSCNRGKTGTLFYKKVSFQGWKFLLKKSFIRFFPDFFFSLIFLFFHANLLCEVYRPFDAVYEWHASHL
ncbi:hypothetical protein DU86_11845 [Methanosarcina mazei]|jgi:hypothetical protein|nr:hypothetical protein DU40_04445 [Methanosarcina mazei]KKG06060.1 hypothetical protein DU31_11125 [Methanosarcina mazei]KKG16366.1 hypothetical protein DU34_05755 [Methanosarcina mazei]KKG28146.1 hypothetical protein DU49_06675 [Methanosarcina mazei]KKG39692.1 hypothetical protein DU39_11905 [Methanosarcina mazei]